LIATSPNVLTVPVGLNVTTLQYFVKLAREKDSAWNYGSVGAGSSAHLVMEMFKQQAQVSLA
jgi:tripartite-type tricarboxylate transporter receptor subunit TctC